MNKFPSKVKLKFGGALNLNLWTPLKKIELLGLRSASFLIFYSSYPLSLC